MSRFKQFMLDDMQCNGTTGLQLRTRTSCWHEQAVPHVKAAQLAELCKSCKHAGIDLPMRLCNGAAECHAE